MFPVGDMKYRSGVTHPDPFSCKRPQSSQRGSNILLVVITAAEYRGKKLEETHFSLALLCECYFYALLHVPYNLSLAYLTPLTSPSLLTSTHAVKRVECKN